MTVSSTNGSWIFPPKENDPNTPNNSLNPTWKPSRRLAFSPGGFGDQGTEINFKASTISEQDGDGENSQKTLTEQQKELSAKKAQTAYLESIDNSNESL